MTWSLDTYEELPDVSLQVVYLCARTTQVDLENTPGLSSAFRNARFSFRIQLGWWEGDFPTLVVVQGQRIA